MSEFPVWRQLEYEFIIIVRKSVFRTWYGTPAVFACESGLSLVNTYERILLLVKFSGMALMSSVTVIQRFDAIMKRGCRERLFCDNLQSPAASFKNSPPAYICLGSGLLRTYVRIELLAYGLIPKADKCGIVTIRIILNRSTSILFKIFE